MDIYELAEFDPDARALHLLEMFEDITSEHDRFILLSDTLHSGLSAGLVLGRSDFKGNEEVENEILEVLNA